METRDNPDRELSRTAWGIAKSSGPWVMRGAAVAVAALFGARACAGCDPTDTGPVDFPFHGNHCGPGHGTDTDAVDPLDEACREHDEALR